MYIAAYIHTYTHTPIHIACIKCGYTQTNPLYKKMLFSKKKFKTKFSITKCKNNSLLIIPKYQVY